MLLCLHVEFVFMLMSFTWLSDDLLKDNPPSKLRLSISAAQICLFCEKYENPRNLEIVRACADKSHLCYVPLLTLSSLPSSHAVFRTFFPSVFPTILEPETGQVCSYRRAFCERKISPIVLYCYSIEDHCELS